MSATRFDPNVEDIHFVLFDQLDIDQELPKIEAYAAFDQDTYSAMLEEARRISVDVLAPMNGPGDREGCKLDREGNVTTPSGYKEAWAIIHQGGWCGMTAPAEAGGIGLPYVIAIAANEFFTGGSMAFTMYMGLTAGAARVVHKFGTDFMREHLAKRMFSGEWGGTMCLTEAGAGTAVGDNRCKATRTDEPGAYLLVGEKIFITGADQDLTSNIIHLVLARTPDAPPGTKGISLFVVPKFLVGDDGSIGERNDAKVASIEHKMGIKGSATCVLTLGATSTCKGYIVGKEGEGLSLMFHLMNEARIGVGGQGQAMGAAAYTYALAYAKERIQGTDLKNFKDASAPRVAIVQHPDVRRMLMWMKVHVETMRSLLYRVAYTMNLIDAGAVPADQIERERGKLELLVPVVKAHCTDVGFDCCVTALQVFGGHGYTGEYPVEQLVRDAKIMTIYEGTNGVQAMDLVGRKLRMNGGAHFIAWMQDALKDCAEAGGEGFTAEGESLSKAINALGATAMHLGGLGMQGKMYGAMLHATPFQTMFGHVALGLEALDQARVAKRIIAERGTTPHLESKALNLKWFVANVLPEATALAKTIQSGDETCLDERLFA